MLLIRVLLPNVVSNYSNSEQCLLKLIQIPRDKNLTPKELQLAKRRLESTKNPELNGFRSELLKWDVSSLDKLQDTLMSIGKAGIQYLDHG